jgi:RimJ/RimL family protein N-acetyltransferase
MHPFVPPPLLEGPNLRLEPLLPEHFEELYTLASDPLVWEQHPNRNRWQLEAFERFFEGALLSGGAYRIVEKSSGKAVGSSRFYDYRPQEEVVNIGYTFFGRAYWGKGYNPEAKQLMLSYALEQVAAVEFHIGAVNKRSQIAIGRLGAIKIDERPVTYHGEQESLNFIYRIHR